MIKQIIYYTLLTTAFTLVNSLSFSQTKQADQFSTWYDFAGNHKIAEGYKLHTLFSFRRHDGLIADNQQELYRIVGIKSVSNKMDVGIGYDFVRTLPYGEFPVDEETHEHRFAQRIVIKQKLSESLNISHRYLLEERFKKDTDMALRMRYMLSANYPLKTWENKGHQLLLTANDEVFINANNDTHLFNQNWAFLGSQYKFDGNKAVSIGYRNQYLIKAKNTKIENNHILALGFNWNIDFTTRSTQ